MIKNTTIRVINELNNKKQLNWFGHLTRINPIMTIYKENEIGKGKRKGNNQNLGWHENNEHKQNRMENRMDEKPIIWRMKSIKKSII